MAFKFERLEVWRLSLAYLEQIYGIANQLPPHERYNLRAQMIRAATSINLNIAEGSIGQTNAEQARFIGMALRSLFETVACLHIVRRLNYLNDVTPLDEAYQAAQVLARKLTALRKHLSPEQRWVREEGVEYQVYDQWTIDDGR